MSTRSSRRRPPGDLAWVTPGITGNCKLRQGGNSLPFPACVGIDYGQINKQISSRRPGMYGLESEYNSSISTDAGGTQSNYARREPIELGSQ